MEALVEAAEAARGPSTRGSQGSVRIHYECAHTNIGGVDRLRLLKAPADGDGAATTPAHSRMGGRRRKGGAGKAAAAVAAAAAAGKSTRLKKRALYDGGDEPEASMFAAGGGLGLVSGGAPCQACQAQLFAAALRCRRCRAVGCSPAHLGRLCAANLCSEAPWHRGEGGEGGEGGESEGEDSPPAGGAFAAVAAAPLAVSVDERRGPGAGRGPAYDLVT